MDPFVIEILKLLLSGVPIAVLGVVSWMASKVNTIEKHMYQINGSVRELKVWAEMHEKSDHDRFDTIHGALDKLQGKCET